MPEKLRVLAGVKVKGRFHSGDVDLLSALNAARKVVGFKFGQVKGRVVFPRKGTPID